MRATTSDEKIGRRWLRIEQIKGKVSPRRERRKKASSGYGNGQRRKKLARRLARRERSAAAVTRIFIPEDARIKFGREVCGNLETAEGREWIVTNGIGGFASGTIAGNLDSALSRIVDRGVAATGWADAVGCGTGRNRSLCGWRIFARDASVDEWRDRSEGISEHREFSAGRHDCRCGVTRWRMRCWRSACG